MGEIIGKLLGSCTEGRLTDFPSLMAEGKTLYSYQKIKKKTHNLRPG